MVIDDLLAAAALWLLVGAVAAWYFCRAAQRLRQTPRSSAGTRTLADTHRTEARRHQPGILDAATLLHAMRVDEHA